MSSQNLPHYHFNCSVAETIRRRKCRENLVWIDSIPLTMPDRDETNADDELSEEGFFASD